MFVSEISLESSELKQKWAQSLNAVPSISVENKEVYPKILQELDELYNSRLEKRIAEIQAQYHERAKKEEKLRNEKIEAAKVKAAQKAQQEAKLREEEAQRHQSLKEKIEKEKLELEERLKKEAEIQAQSKPAEPVSEQTVLPVVSQPDQTSVSESTSENNKDPRHDALPNLENIAAVITNVEKTCAALIKARNDDYW